MARLLRWQIVTALAGGLIILSLLASLAFSTGTTAVPFYNRAYVEGVVGAPAQLNPLLQTTDGPSSERDISALLFDGLTQPGPDGAAEPALAERWDIDPSGHVYTFTLRSSLRWHDGVRLTAGDVSFTAKAVQSPDFEGDDRLTTIWRNVKVEEIDEQRIRFTLSAPFAPFLAATHLPILPRHLLGNVPPVEWAESGFSRQPVGAGPFRLRSMNDTQAVLVPFEGAARGRPALDLLVLRFYPSADVAADALRRREVQGVARDGGARSVSSAFVRSSRLPLARYTGLTFNLRVPPLDDQRLRVALAQGLDRQSLIERTIGAGGISIRTPILPQSWAHVEFDTPGFDESAANQSLDALGWRRGADGMRARGGSRLRLPLLSANNGLQLATAREIARQWRALGIEVPIEVQTADVLLDRIGKRDFTMLVTTWNELDGDPDPFPQWHSSQAANGANYAGYADTQSDKLLSDARTTTDQEARRRLYAEWARRWASMAPSLPLYQHTLVYDLDAEVQPSGLDRDRLFITPEARFSEMGGWDVEGE